MVKKRKSYKKIYREYLEKGMKLERWQKIGILFLVIVISGFVGWLYEFLLTWVENGEIYMEGGNFLPWMNIYAIGALFVIPITYKIRRRPWAVFLVSVIVTGVVELIGGWLAYVLFNGARYWDYRNAWWGVGNINGFVCPASVTIFGLGCLALVYFVVPFCIYLAQKMSKRAFLTLAIFLFTIVMIDELTNLILKNLNLPTAMDFYRSIGWKYLT
ncbi:putative ABC transporter permease [Candidatus Saccharibacteria bacterium]|nr:putative ABC transporter permease [Candidatus Saccharibacteria bacterium]